MKISLSAAKNDLRIVADPLLKLFCNQTVPLLDDIHPRLVVKSGQTAKRSVPAYLLKVSNLASPSLVLAEPSLRTLLDVQ